MRIKTFSIIPANVRYARISDLSKIVWCEIYVENYCDCSEIKNDTISEALGKNIITISRAISELKKAKLININYNCGKRYITINAESRVDQVDQKAGEKSNTEMPIALKKFYELWENPVQEKLDI
jgi:DNA-binding transcriptional ArsR family regulator